MADKNKWFVEEFANPHSRLLMAEILHEQATALYRTRDRSSILTRRDANNLVVQQTRGIDKSVFLLGGFALENAIKAFLVYENPHWISNGRLSGKLKSHSLTKLQEQSSLIPYKKKLLWVLRAFESGLDSWFRYPCALTIEDTKQERELYGTFWDGYERVMRAYGKRLTELLTPELTSTLTKKTELGEKAPLPHVVSSPTPLRSAAATRLTTIRIWAASIALNGFA